MVNNSTSPLQHSLFELICQENVENLPIVRCTKSTLIHLSHTLEDTILKNKIPAMLFTGFQESSHWRKETDRYQELSAVVMQICIFAGKPLPPESDAKQLHIELADGDPLRQEWFLLILSDEFSVLLCGQDSNTDAPDELQREFDTVWTFDETQIARTLDILEKVIAHYRPEKLVALQDARKTFRLHPPNPQLLSQFVINVLSYETSLTNQIRRQAMMLETVMSNVGIYAYTVESKPDGKMRLQVVSGDFEKLFGYPLTSSEDANYWFEKLVHPEDKPRFYANQRKLVPNTFASNDYRYVHKDGHTIWLRLISHTVPAPNGFIRYGTCYDITPLYNAKIIQLENERLGQALEHEKELNATRTYFINSVMHEFRNPLATVLLASEMLERYKDKMTEDEKMARLRMIQNEIVQLRSTLDDMSLIMNNEVSDMGFNPDVEDADIYFGGLIDHFRKGKGSRHRVVVEDTVPKIPILLDTRLLKYVIPAMLTNAAQYSEQNTTITCRMSHDGEHLFFSVTDEGIGIPEADQPNIFKPLFRGSNISPTHHGGGLGLTIAEECIRLHQGRIEFISKEGQGSTFTAILPYLLA
jgi:PAS domain S-box-containing protein